jgi:mannonate dehydratase
MKLGLKFSLQHITEENLRFAKQLGVTHIVVHGPRLGESGTLEFDQLLRLRKFIESQGLEAVAIENLPHDHWEDVLLAGPRRDAQLDNICRTVENMGKTGWPILGYYFSIAGVWGHWRSYQDGGGRGDAGLKSFDYDLVKDAPEHESGPVSIDEMWDRMAYFLKRVIPVAEEAGVKLGAHQDDPPAPYLRGIGRLLTSHDNMQRLLDLVPSPSNCLELCQGTVAEMGPNGVIDAIRRFAGQGKIAYVHFRNVRGQFPKFDEVFIDEGDVDMLEAIQAYKEAGFDGVITPDHAPRVEGETGYGYRGRAFALGYIKALMHAAGVR